MKLLIIFCLIASISFAQDTKLNRITTDIIPFNEGSGTRAYDYGTSGLIFSMTNSPVYSNDVPIVTSYKANSSVCFNGQYQGFVANLATNYWVDTTATTRIPKFTISVWVKAGNLDSSPTFGGIIFSSGIGATVSYGLAVYGDGSGNAIPALVLKTGSSVNQISTTMLFPTNQWTFITASFNQNLSILFSIGTQFETDGATATVTNSNTPTLQAVKIGYDYWSGSSNNFTGCISDLQIRLGSTLTSNQILGMASGEFSPARRTGMK